VKAWLHGGPFDGAAIEVGAPVLVHAVEVWRGLNLHRYEHHGPPDEPDRWAPEVGVDLQWVSVTKED
jgi:hypothetical protein